ncbi:MAG: class I SAM-dependent methyltransferase [Candidatus Latescibacterota bacterium]|nr:MAG: class I SAM-dependent methyltransferase [Candidatus Latescibacterota bacterium]
MSADKTNDVSKVLDALTDITHRLTPGTFRLFIEDLLRWNPRLGLVSKRNTGDVTVKLVRQSVRLWDFTLKNSGLRATQHRLRVVDFGTGGGFPGLVWKLVSPEIDLTLVDRKDRKVAFLERVIARLGLTSVEAFTLDIREFSRRETFQGKFDLAVSMAVSQPEPMAADVSRILKSPGFFCTIRRRAETPPRVLGRSLTIRSEDRTPDGRLVLYENTPAPSLG